VNEALRWLPATVLRLHEETAEVKTISFDTPGWPGHLAGQHVDIRLTADDGYAAQRSYSIGSPAGVGTRIELTVERVEGGEVSPFLLDELRAGDRIELRGPIGGYFTWSPGASDPLLLIAGGSGIVPLMSMLRTRAGSASRAPARLLYSSRSEEHIIYRAELDRLHGAADGFLLSHTLTRRAPPGWSGERGRIGREMLERRAFAPGEGAQTFICGPTPFVEAVSELLLAIGHAEASIRTERFGPSGEAR
jgi:ferredoxin-NADP reductase